MAQCFYFFNKATWVQAGLKFKIPLFQPPKCCAVSVRVSIAGKRHYDHSHFYKETFHWGWLTVERFSLLSSWCEAWQHMGRHVCQRRSWEVYVQTGRNRTRGVRHWNWLELLKPTELTSRNTVPPTWPHLLQQSHAFSLYGPIGPFSFKPPHRHRNTFKGNKEKWHLPSVHTDSRSGHSSILMKLSQECCQESSKLWPAG